MTVIIDPIDGTNNFINGINHFCTAIAVRDQNGAVQIGLVYDPIKNDLFYSIGNGSFCNNLKINTNKNNLKNGLLLISDGLSDRKGNQRIIEAVKRLGINYKILGAANLDLCQIASGKAIGYVKTNAPEWDYLAGKFIVENAGGKCELINGNIVASNGTKKIHRVLIKLVYAKK